MRAARAARAARAEGGGAACAAALAPCAEAVRAFGCGGACSVCRLTASHARPSGASDLFDCSGKHQFCSEERWDVSIDRFLEDDSYLSEVRPPTPCPAHAPAFIH